MPNSIDNIHKYLLEANQVKLKLPLPNLFSDNLISTNLIPHNLLSSNLFYYKAINYQFEPPEFITFIKKAA